MPSIVFLKVPPLGAPPLGAPPLLTEGAAGRSAVFGTLPVSWVLARWGTGFSAAGGTPNAPPHALHCWTVGDCGVPQCGQGTMLTVTGRLGLGRGEA